MVILKILKKLFTPLSIQYKNKDIVINSETTIKKEYTKYIFYFIDETFYLYLIAVILTWFKNYTLFMNFDIALIFYGIILLIEILITYIKNRKL